MSGSPSRPLEVLQRMVLVIQAEPGCHERSSLCRPRVRMRMPYLHPYACCQGARKSGLVRAFRPDNFAYPVRPEGHGACANAAKADARRRRDRGDFRPPAKRVGSGSRVITKDARRAKERTWTARRSAQPASAGFGSRSQQHGPTAVFAPAGELDHHTAELLSEPMDEAIEAGTRRLVVDCSQLEFCDSTGLNVLLSARLRPRPEGGAVHLAAMRPTVARVLEITGADAVFTVHETPGAGAPGLVGPGPWACEVSYGTGAFGGRPDVFGEIHRAEVRRTQSDIREVRPDEHHPALRRG